MSDNSVICAEISADGVEAYILTINRRLSRLQADYHAALRDPHDSGLRIVANQRLSDLVNAVSTSLVYATSGDANEERAFEAKQRLCALTDRVDNLIDREYPELLERPPMEGDPCSSPVGQVQNRSRPEYGPGANPVRTRPVFRSGS